MLGSFLLLVAWVLLRQTEKFNVPVVGNLPDVRPKMLFVHVGPNSRFPVFIGSDRDHGGSTQAQRETRGIPYFVERPVILGEKIAFGWFVGFVVVGFGFVVVVVGLIGFDTCPGFR